MNLDRVTTELAPLIDAAPASQRRWLQKLFANRSTFQAYSGLDNELFVHDRYQSGPVLVASASRGEGRTTIALTLAALTCVFDPNRRVLLVDADVDNGTLATDIFGFEAGHAGLLELFDGNAQASECLHQTSLPNLWVTPLRADGVGAIRFSPTAFQDFIATVSDRFDLMVIDSPAGGGNRSILSLASVIKRIFLVVKYGGATHEQIQHLLGDLNRVDAQVLGAVLNQREFVVPRLLYGAR